MIKPGKWMNVFPVIMIGCSVLVATIPISIFTTTPMTGILVLICALCLYLSFVMARTAKRMFDEIPKVLEMRKKWEEENDDY